MFENFEKHRKSIELQISCSLLSHSETMKAECDAYCMQKEAEALLIEATNNAKAKELLAAAEGKAAPKLRRQREYELSKLQVEMYRSLAKNENVVVTGTSKSSNMLADMMVSQKHAQIMLNVDGTASGTMKR